MNKTVGGVLRLVWLETFLAVCEHGTYSKAAVQLGVHQTSVTRYMKALSVWLRSPLFLTYEPITLTAEGKAFVPVARDVCEKLQNCRAPLPTKPPKTLSARDIKINKPK